jgi:hypothetical protein
MWRSPRGTTPAALLVDLTASPGDAAEMLFSATAPTAEVEAGEAGVQRSTAKPMAHLVRRADRRRSRVRQRAADRSAGVHRVTVSATSGAITAWQVRTRADADPAAAPLMVSVTTRPSGDPQDAPSSAGPDSTAWVARRPANDAGSALRVPVSTASSMMIAQPLDAEEVQGPRRTFGPVRSLSMIANAAVCRRFMWR